ncbi:MAG: T9SS type A sorting domain-containing protein [Saprospiraceae bacterium]|nr:T9SS type A sorting domain-containing protein [Saprospiraceae bacterium]
MKILNLIVLLLFTRVLAIAVTCTWIGPTTGNWGTAANWSCGHVPLPADDVVITNALVTLDVSPVVNNLNVTRSTSYVIDGPGNLTVNGAFNMLGNINNSGGITINGTLNWNYSFVAVGTVTCNGVTTIGSVNSVGISFSTVVLNGGGTWVGHDLTFFNPQGVLRVPVGATLEHTGTDATIGNGNPSGRFEVLGTFKKTGAGTLSNPLLPGLNFINSGTFDIGPGCTYSSGGVLTNSGLIKGSGQIFVNVLNQTGSIAPGNSPGILTLSKLPSGTTNTYIELQGTTTPGVDYDQIQIPGTGPWLGPGVISGTLNISFLNGFTPVIGNQFIIMTCANGCTGNFSNIVHPGSNPNAWQIDMSNPNQVKLILGQKLPIHLVNFSAKLIEDRVNLLWSTASESNNMGYFVDRMNNEDGSWKEIGFVSGQSLIKQENYSYDDERPQPGFNYYRLRQVDFKGKEEYSGIVKIEFSYSNNINDLVVAPNPVFDKTLVTIPEGGISMEVFDVNGRLVLSKGVQSATSVYLNMEGFQIGIYLVKIITGSGFKSVRIFKK